MRFLDPKAIKDWIKSRAVNSMMTTEKGFFMDARQGPVIREELDDIQTGLNEINSKLSTYIKIVTAETTVSIPPMGYYHIEKLNISVPPGYKAINFLTGTTSRDMTFCFACNYVSGGIDAYIQNISQNQMDNVKCIFKTLVLKI